MIASSEQKSELSLNLTSISTIEVPSTPMSCLTPSSNPKRDQTAKLIQKSKPVSTNYAVGDEQSTGLRQPSVPRKVALPPRNIEVRATSAMSSPFSRNFSKPSAALIDLNGRYFPSSNQPKQKVVVERVQGESQQNLPPITSKAKPVESVQKDNFASIHGPQDRESPSRVVVDSTSALSKEQSDEAPAPHKMKNNFPLNPNALFSKVIDIVVNHRSSSTHDTSAATQVSSNGPTIVVDSNAQTLRDETRQVIQINGVTRYVVAESSQVAQSYGKAISAATDAVPKDQSDTPSVSHEVKYNSGEPDSLISKPIDSASHFGSSSTHDTSAATQVSSNGPTIVVDSNAQTLRDETRQVIQINGVTRYVVAESPQVAQSYGKAISVATQVSSNGPTTAVDSKAQEGSDQSLGARPLHGETRRIIQLNGTTSFVVADPSQPAQSVEKVISVIDNTVLDKVAYSSKPSSITSSPAQAAPQPQSNPPLQNAPFNAEKSLVMVSTPTQTSAPAVVSQQVGVQSMTAVKDLSRHDAPAAIPDSIVHAASAAPCFDTLETLKVRILEALSAQKEYPTIALKRRIEGSVVIALAVRQDGSLDYAKIHTRSGSSILDKAALKLACSIFPLKVELTTAVSVLVPIEYRIPK
jgi:TonB family protein